MGRANAFATLIGAAVSGCVTTITTQTTYSDTFVEDRSVVSPVAGSIAYHAAASLDGTTLALVIDQDEHCATTVTPVYHRIAHHELQPGGAAILRPQWMAVIGAIVVGSGAVFYFGAENASMTTGAQTVSHEVGVAIGLVGLGILAVAGINQLRMRDTEEDLGNLPHDAQVTEATCHDRQVANAPVTLGVGDSTGWHVDGKTDASGRAQLALTELPEAAFQNGMAAFEVAVGGTTVPVTGLEQAGLLEALAADPASRVARDRAATPTRR